MSSPTPTTAITPDCAHWKTITYSAAHDSPETIRQIIEQNAARKAECEKGSWGSSATWGKSPMTYRDADGAVYSDLMLAIGEEKIT